MLAEVAAQALAEGVAPDVGHELLEDRPALGVGDPVEVHRHVDQVPHVRIDGVGVALLVLLIGPGLLVAMECRPRVRPLGRLGLADRRGPLGERLVEPQVVPPLHRHEVAEPHVRQLVQDRQRPALDERLGGLPAEDVGVGDRHAAGVLHGPGVVLGDEQLVVLREREGAVELLLEEQNSRLGAVE